MLRTSQIQKIPELFFTRIYNVTWQREKVKGKKRSSRKGAEKQRKDFNFLLKDKTVLHYTAFVQRRFRNFVLIHPQSFDLNCPHPSGRS